ncbi:hypothetical protein FK268_20955 [Tsukamurella sputi]|uniref:Transcription elongation factor GreA/GreB C-terminal domain-containing protein n=1 Tax=Tsukamurella sputi TaxID=2591848 RepID=A0A5C5RHJ1_9ACTN|nr:uracil-DNA glycosylase [Tsukamurella sputi]TWS22240.1 hypothetical protein FK268_20955 [Tsukamurella sputi]
MQWCSDATYREDLYRRRYDPHVRPVNELVDRLREERDGAFVPYVAPTYGGVNARLLALLQDPGPKTRADSHDGSGMLCIENADPTAERYKTLLAEAGIDVSDIQAWNSFPWQPTTTVRRGHRTLAPTEEDVRHATDALARLVALLPRLRVVLLHGVQAKAAWPRLQQAYPELAAGVRVIDSWHPLAANPAYKSPAQVEKYAREIEESFTAAARHLRDPRQMFYNSTITPASSGAAADEPPDMNDQPGRTRWRIVSRKLGDLKDRYVARTTNEPAPTVRQQSDETPDIDSASSDRQATPSAAGEGAAADRTTAGTTTADHRTASADAPTNTPNEAAFDREIEQYRIAEEALLARRRDLRSRMDECRDSRERLEDYQQLSDDDRAIATRLADLERAKGTYLRQRDRAADWARRNGVSTDSRAFRGSIVTIEYPDGEQDTFVLTERDTDTEYETVSHESRFGQSLKLVQVGDAVDLVNGQQARITAIQPGFRISAPTR